MERLIEVRAKVERVFGLLSDPVNLPAWTSGSGEVQIIDSRQFRWLVKSANGSGLQDVLVQAFEPPAYLLWQATPNSREQQSENAFTLEAYFEATKRRSTVLRLIYTEAESSGAPPALTAREFEQNLENFKSFVERYDERPTQEVAAASPATSINLDSTPAAEQTGSKALLPQTSTHSSIAVEATNPSVRTLAGDNTPSHQPLTGQPLTEIPLSRRATREEVREEQGSTSKGPLSRHRRVSSLWLTLLGLVVLITLAAGLLVWIARQRQQKQEGRRGEQQQVSREDAPASDATAVAVAAVAPLEKDVNSNSPERVDEPPQASRPETQGESAKAGKEVGPAGEDGDGQRQLRQALSGWVAATNARDLEALMSFYAPVAERYYLRENFTTAQIRADKRSLDERAILVDVRADDPEVIFSSDRRTARMTFNKEYNVEGSKINKRGRVLAELRWAKSGDGDWKIVSERDLRVDR